MAAAHVFNTESTKVNAVSHLPKAPFAQHHQEVEIRQFHPISAPVVVEFGDGISCLLICSLGPCSNLGSLQNGDGMGRKEKELLKTGERSHYKPVSAPETPCSSALFQLP